MKIDPSKKYTTLDGKPVTHLHRAPEGWPTSFPWRGAIDSCGTGTWSDDGKYTDEEIHRFDLVEVREPMLVKLWVKDGHGPIFCVSDTELNILKMNVLGYTLKEFVEVMQ
jgi:hypothetical protein